MNVNQDDYYIAVFTNQSHMLLTSEDSEIDFGNMLLSQSLRSDVARSVVGRVYVAAGDVQSFTPNDYNQLSPALVSPKFKSTLQKLDLPSVDFYPSVIRCGEQVWDGYFAMHVWNTVEALDELNSVYDGSIDRILVLDSIALNEGILQSIPFENRRLFSLKEHPTYIYHQVVVDELRKNELTGIEFLSVSEWTLDKSLAF